MGKRRTWRWVTRDPGCGVVFIWFGIGSVSTPVMSDDVSIGWVIQNRSDSFVMCYQPFKAATGITVPTDHPIKVDFGGCKVVE